MSGLKYVFVFLFAVCCTLSISAQNYPINAATNGTTINTCQGTIYDSGGPSSNYSNSEFYTVTFCSANGSQLILDVLQFQIENFYDDLLVYDGPSTASPLIIQATGNQIQGMSFTTSGPCVTLVFDTDGSVTSTGFAIDITCAFPCQAIDPSISFDPLLNLGPDGQILTCAGSQVNFNGSALFPENGDTYIQSIGTSTFDWYVNGNLSFTGQAFALTPGMAGIYNIELEVTDFEGCSNTISVSEDVLVTGEGSFLGTSVDLSTVCVGDVVNLTGFYDNEPVVIDVEQTNDILPGNPLVFPGSPIEISSDLTVSGFTPGQTITDIDQIDAICIVMEHSYVGDLDITVICPSGTQVLLLDEEFGGNNLGTTNNGYEYCFSPDEPPGNTLDYQGINPIPAGQYASFDPMDAFEGCDINGTWQIVINDNLFADDGYLFDWYIQFDEDFVGNQNVIPETILSSQWTPDPSIIVNSGDQAVVQPNSSGQHCYTYEVTTQFCTHDTTICIDVEAGPAILFDPVPVLCSGQDPVSLVAFPLGGTWSGAAAPDGTFNPSTAGTFWAYYETLPTLGTCSSLDSLELTVEAAPTAVISGGGAICNGSNATIDVTLDVPDVWTIVFAINGIAQPPVTFNGTITSFDTATEGTYTLVSADNGICEATLMGSVEVTIETGPQVSIGGDVSLCPGTSTDFIVDFEGTGPYTFSYTIDGALQSAITTSDNPYFLAADQPGTYVISSFTTQNCIGTTSGQATLTNFPSSGATISGDASLCPGESADVLIDFIGNAPFTFEYAIDGVGQGLVSSSDDPYIIPTTTAGSYTLLSVNDANCQGSTAGIAEVETLSSPTAIMSGGGTLCPNGSTEIFIDFTGTAPFQFEYYIDGTSQGLVTTSMDPYVLTTGIDGDYSFSDFSDANCDGSTNGSATIDVLDLPTATIIGGGSVCPGDEVEIEISFIGTGPFTFTYSVEGLLFGPFTTDDAFYTFMVNAIGTYTITSFSTANCPGIGAGQAVVEASPTPSAIFTQADVAICPNEENTASISLGGVGPWTLDWSIDGNSQPTVEVAMSPFTFDVGQAGTYTIEQVNSGNCSAPGSNEMNVTELDLPTATLSGQDIVCPGSAGELSVDLSGSGPWVVGYSIDGVPSGNETFLDIASLWSVLTEGLYSLTTVSDANCSNTANGTAELDWYAVPDAIFQEAEATVCEGDSYDFTVELSGTAPYTISYLLDGLAQTDILSVTDNTILTGLVPGDYTLVNVSDANCSSSLNSSVTLSIYPPLTAAINGPSLFCVGDTIGLSANIIGGSGENQSFLWTDGDGQTFSTSSLNYVISDSQSFTLTVNDGCEVPFSTSEELFVGQSYPQPSIQIDIDSVCVGVPVTMSHSDEVVPQSCIWTFSDGSTTVGCGSVYEAFQEAGPVGVTLTTSTSAGCSTTLIIDSLVEVLPVPEADFFFRSDPGNIYAPSVLFYNESSYATGYLWDFGDGNTSEEVTPRHDFPGGDAVDYIVCLEAMNELGCADSTCLYVPIETIFTVHIPNAFTPDGDAINDCFAPIINDVELAEYDFAVYDSWGQEVYRSMDREMCWNGRGADDEHYYAGASVYSYRLLVRPIDTVEKLEYTGTVVLVR